VHEGQRLLIDQDTESFRKMSEAAKKSRQDTALIVKSLNSLMGIVSGLVSDGELNEKEILFLKTWCDEHRLIAGEYPANIIFRRVHEVLLDGVISTDEREFLLRELTILSGSHFAETGSAQSELIDGLFDDDPSVIFDSNEFVFTGKFMFGTREACEAATLKRGATVKKDITQKTNYLVIGSRASPEWIAENFGRKIQKAADMANSGDFEIAIVREVDWTLSLS
jgi:NAD-dependent DNA ligase